MMIHYHLLHHQYYSIYQEESVNCKDSNNKINKKSYIKSGKILTEMSYPAKNNN